jgi:drug/metabolite transporter (DMT)-like permease
MWVTPVLWSGAFLTGAAALVRLSADTVSFLRFAITVALGAVLFRRQILAFLRASPGRRQWAALGWLALVGGVVYHVAFYAGLARSQPPIASVVIATNPMLTALGAALFLRPLRIARHLVIGLALAFAGVVALAADKPIPAGSGMAESASLIERLVGGWGVGETLCLVASVAWATYAVLLQRFRSRSLAGLPTVAVTFFTYAITAAMLLPIVVATGGIGEIPTMTLGDWGCMLYIGAIATVIAYTIYNAAIDRIGAPRVAQVTYAVPALTTLLTLWLVPGFRPTVLTWAGLASVTAGLIVSDGRLAASLRRG